MLENFEQNVVLFDKKAQKMVDHFWQCGDVILEDVSVTETIVWYLTINLF